MSEVWIYHPGLDRYSQVLEPAVGVWARSGWIQQDPPPAPEEPTEESADGAAAEAEPKTRSTRKSSATRPASDEE